MILSHALGVIPYPRPQPTYARQMIRATELRGAKTALRPPRTSDTTWLASALNDPEFHRWMPMVPYPYTLADAEQFIAHTEQAWESRTECAFFVCQGDTDGDQPCGGITLHLVASDPGMAGVGYWLEGAARERGLASDALRTISKWAFSEVGIERLHLTTLPNNQPSQRVAERAGFVREGLLRAWAPTEKGRKDALIYSLLAQERH